MAASLPSTMKVVHQPSAAVIDLVLESGPLPVPSDPEDVLIKMHTATPCVGELHWEVWFPSLYPVGGRPERVPCTEGAGVIAQTPNPELAKSFGFKVGDEVFFRVKPTQLGHLREYTLAHLSQIAHKPKNMSWVEAGATPLSTLTAWQGVFQHGLLDSAGILGDAEALKKNKNIKVIVTGASGVVGGLAVRFAHLAGAGAVYGVAGGSQADSVKKQGADDVIDYKKQSVGEWVAQDPANREVDFALDCVGGDMLKSLWAGVKTGGTLLSVTGDPTACKPEGCTKELKEAKWYLVEPNGKHLEAISKLVEKGEVTTKIDSAVDLADFQVQFDKVENKQARGKCVIKISS